MSFRGFRRFHLMGAGGAGMSGVAELLAAQGAAVTGCDSAPGAFAEAMAARGLRVDAGHDPAHVEHADVLVVSSAIARDHPEVAAAHARGIPVVRRAEMLGELARGRLQVAIGGTHGKSTTTAMAGAILTAAGLDPTVVVGGQLRGTDANVRLGRGEAFVVEADEYDRSFLTLQPVYALVTSVDADHLDTYGGMRALTAAFVEFLNRVPFHGRAVWCADHPRLRRLVKRVRAPLLSYGQSPRAEMRATRIRTRGEETTFDLARPGAAALPLRLRVPGRLNVQNAAGAAALSLALGVEADAVAAGLAGFAGVGRRFEAKPAGRDVLVFDDYAHHPEEIRATLRAAREGWSRRLVAVFQPHLYSRTRDLAREFGRALALADVVLVTDVYAAREAPLPGVDGALLARAVRAAGRDDVEHVPDKRALAARVLELVRPGDLVLTMGAGDVGAVADEVAAGLRNGGTAASSFAPSGATERPW